MINIDISIVDKGVVLKQGQINADDWDAAYQDILEAESKLVYGQWLQKKIRASSGEIPKEYVGRI